jgi:hypothetical protein
MERGKEGLKNSSLAHVRDLAEALMDCWDSWATAGDCIDCVPDAEVRLQKTPQESAAHP